MGPMLQADAFPPRSPRPRTPRSPALQDGTEPVPDFGVLGLPELRALRRSAQQEEADLSYLRRLLQGRIDRQPVVRVEAGRDVGGADWRKV